jgi:hypothetical protein
MAVQPLPLTALATFQQSIPHPTQAIPWSSHSPLRDKEDDILGIISSSSTQLTKNLARAGVDATALVQNNILVNGVSYIFKAPHTLFKNAITLETRNITSALFVTEGVTDKQVAKTASDVQFILKTVLKNSEETGLTLARDKIMPPLSIVLQGPSEINIDYESNRGGAFYARESTLVYLNVQLLNTPTLFHELIHHVDLLLTTHTGGDYTYLKQKALAAYEVHQYLEANGHPFSYLTHPQEFVTIALELYYQYLIRTSMDGLVNRYGLRTMLNRKQMATIWPVTYRFLKMYYGGLEEVTNFDAKHYRVHQIGVNKVKKLTLKSIHNIPVDLLNLRREVNIHNKHQMSPPAEKNQRLLTTYGTVLTLLNKSGEAPLPGHKHLVLTDANRTFIQSKAKQQTQFSPITTYIAEFVQLALFTAASASGIRWDNANSVTKIQKLIMLNMSLRPTIQLNTSLLALVNMRQTLLLQPNWVYVKQAWELTRLASELNRAKKIKQDVQIQNSYRLPYTNNDSKVNKFTAMMSDVFKYKRVFTTAELETIRRFVAS